MPASISSLQQMAIFMTIVTGGSCSMMYYLMQKNFARSDYYRLAMDQLRTHESAMGSLGAPPLQAHSIRLTDRHNRVDKVSAKIKIPVSGTKSSGYLYTSSTKDTFLNKLLKGVVIVLECSAQREAVNTNMFAIQNQLCAQWFRKSLYRIEHKWIGSDGLKLLLFFVCDLQLNKKIKYIFTNKWRWCLQEAVLHLHNGQRIAVFETEKAEPGDMDFENPSTGASF